MNFLGLNEYGIVFMGDSIVDGIDLL